MEYLIHYKLLYNIANIKFGALFISKHKYFVYYFLLFSFLVRINILLINICYIYKKMIIIYK
jgi:hypothetical protein